MVNRRPRGRGKSTVWHILDENEVEPRKIRCYRAVSLLSGADTTTSLGDYCFFVVLICFPFFTVNAQASAWLLAVYSVLWSRLWGVFWIAKGLQKNLGNFVACDPSVTAASNIGVAVLLMFGWGVIWLFAFESRNARLAHPRARRGDTGAG